MTINDKPIDKAAFEFRWRAAKRFLRREVSFKMPIGILLGMGLAQLLLLLLAFD